MKSSVAGGSVHRVLLVVAWLGPAASSASAGDGSSTSRIAALEKKLHLQSNRIADLERTVPKEFEVTHYNVLADQAGRNTVPWFCYGAEVTKKERLELHRRFYAEGDKNKRLEDKGWPTWAEGVLSPERIAAVEACELSTFAWERRKWRLWHEVASHRVGFRDRAPDIITLAECDHFDDFWSVQFESNGYKATWRKRPRRSARDGCAIAWRDSTFELVAEGGFDFGSKRDATAPDRTCCFALLRWRRDPSVRLLIATTHLERDPESTDADISRGFQYGAIFREMLAFAGAHDAEDVPVVLTGDLNAKDCDELAGIARALVRLLKSPTHPLLWSVMDAPTSATTVTESRHLRIDYILFQSAAIALTGIGRMPRLSAPIPDADHASDHLPVSARLVLRTHWEQVEGDARQWLACISGTTTVRPLSGDALRLAFDFFDKDGSGLVSQVELEAGMTTLGYPGLDTSAIHAALIRAQCHPRTESDELYDVPTVRAPAAGSGFGSGGSGFGSGGSSGGSGSSGSSDSRRGGDSSDCGIGSAPASIDGAPAEVTATWEVSFWAEAEERSWAIDHEAFVQVYTDSVQRRSSTMARQLEKAFRAFDVWDTGVLSQNELRDALRRMASAPLDEDALDEVLLELGAAYQEGLSLPGHQAITSMRAMAHTRCPHTHSHGTRAHIGPSPVCVCSQIVLRLDDGSVHEDGQGPLARRRLNGAAENERTGSCVQSVRVKRVSWRLEYDTASECKINFLAH